MQNSIQHLEFNKLIDLIKNNCHSLTGKQLTANIKPINDIDIKISKIKLINEIQRLLVLGYSYQFDLITDLSDLLLDWAHNSYNYDEFKLIIDCIIYSNNIINNKDSFTEYPLFSNKVNQLSPFFYLEKRFNEIYSIEGEVLDTASKELSNIRKRKKQLRKNIIQELDSLQKDQQWERHLQDKIVSHRDDRYVLLIKEGASGFVDGISHGRSASNASIYFEPKQIVGLNNELNKIDSEEQQEIYRILCQFSQEIFEVKTQINNNSCLLAELDCDFAIARFSNRIMATCPTFVEQPYLELINARHPLLIIQYNDIKKVIPFNLKLGQEKKILLISGPNTGGKTITLKAIGLLTLMAHSGLPIPAESGSKIGLYKQIFADIGDNQSIESYLSSFSAHIKNLANMLDHGDENTLVLIDEIGAATDPEQGSALAQAILEKFVNMNVTGIITTHYTALKIFAEHTETCVNASMQFDSNNHLPTYQFQFGMPGHSFAIEIAASLGIDKNVINKAKDLAGNQSVELTHLLTKLSDEKSKLSRATYQHELKSKLLEQKAYEFEKKTKEFESLKKEKIRESLLKTNEELTHLQKELNREIDEIKKLSKTEKRKQLEKASQKINIIQNDLIDRANKLNKQKQHYLTNDEIVVGSIVWLKKMETNATVVEISKDSAKVDMNGIFFTLPMSDLILQEKKAEKQEAVISSNINSSDNISSFELKLLGLTFDEAKPLIDEFIDHAVFNRLNRIRIVHGKGTGILRSKVRSYLKQNKRVKDFFAPPQEAGGDGVTVVCIS
ncbi:MAG TPA: Smr/MutS family protein [Candidatus Cloacimonadota bacterium]|nr:Smr/MutS family protein [Candidatus Cloacimonadota bacterium]HOQ79886.1 Smr/MutS family protein [Candidatus Cloacimonadota bacterium]